MNKTLSFEIIESGKMGKWDSGWFSGKMKMGAIDTIMKLINFLYIFSTLFVLTHPIPTFPLSLFLTLKTSK